MSDYLATACTAFVGSRKLAGGALIDVALAIRAAAAAGDPVLAFDDATGAVIDLDLRGSTAEIVARLTEQGEALAARARKRSGGEAPARGRGRPRLGVVAREVTLLPRQWEWLAAQPGGASQMLRRLVDEARRSGGGQADLKAARERTYRFLSGIAGDLPDFEETIRALFSGSDAALADRMAGWPPDIRAHALMLARTTTAKEAP